VGANLMGIEDRVSSGSPTSTVVVADDLSKAYTKGWLGRRSFKALQNVNLEVKRGEVFGLLGPNGAGKTTLIKLLLGIIHPTSGRARVLDESAGSLAARRRIGYLPENLVFPRHHTGEGALYFYGRLSGLRDSVIKKRTGPLLELVGLAGRHREHVRKYSKGMRQRLGLAQAMLHEPEVLILDEPTDGLDPLGRSQIRDLIERLRADGKSVFLNSHILQEVELVCDRVAIMAHGRIRAVGAIDELIERYSKQNQLSVTIEVAGAEAICRRMFVGPQVQSFGSAGITESNSLESNQRYRVVLSLEQQAESDQWVDRIRQAGLSLLKLERHRLKLEEIFLQLVANLEQDTVASGKPGEQP
jgi:ABC-2 type transport system ATP-binding protein